MNLFTDSVLALDIENGQLRWYYQLVHHDVWDYDNGSQPILFDMEVDGEPVRALGQANKNAFLYLLNRETGAPIHSIIETPVPTETEPGGRGAVADAADSAQGGRRADGAGRAHLPRGDPAGARRREDPGADLHADRAQPDLRASGFGGGASYGPMAYSEDTGLLYVNAIDRPFDAGRGPRMFFSAYDPTTGELIWRQIREGYGQAGPVVTSGGVVFVGPAATSRATSSPSTRGPARSCGGSIQERGVFSSPAVYMVNGEQFVTVASGGGDRGRRGGDLHPELRAARTRTEGRAEAR